AVEVFGRQGAVVEPGGFLVLIKLDVELETADAREVVLARIEEHALEQSRSGVERRWVTRTQLAVDLDQRLFRLADGVAAKCVADDVAYVVALGEEDLKAGDAGLKDLVQLVGGQLLVCLIEQLAGGEIDHVGGSHRAVELASLYLDLLDLMAAQTFQTVGRNLASSNCNLFALNGNGGSRTRSLQIGRRSLGGNLPAQLALVHVDGIDGIEGLENLFIRAQTESTQEDRSQELALTV